MSDSLLPHGLQHSRLYTYIHIYMCVCVCVCARVCCVQLPQSCLALCDPMDSSPPGSSVHGILQARILGGWGSCHVLLQGIFLTQGLNPCHLCLLHRLVGSLSLVSPVYIYKSQIFFICSFVDEYVGCFRTLDTVNCGYEHWGACFFSN